MQSGNVMVVCNERLRQGGVGEGWVRNECTDFDVWYGCIVPPGSVDGRCTVCKTHRIRGLGEKA